MSSRFIMPFADVGSGIKPSSGAKLFFFELDGVTPKNTFSDQLASPTANTNPVISDSNGVFGDIYINGDYKITLQNKNGSQIFGGVIVEEVGQAANINILSLAYVFDTVATMVASTIVFPVGKVINIKQPVNGGFASPTFTVALTSSVTAREDDILTSTGYVTNSFVRSNPDGNESYKTAEQLTKYTMTPNRHVFGEEYLWGLHKHLIDTSNSQYIEFLWSGDSTTKGTNAGAWKVDVLGDVFCDKFGVAVYDNINKGHSGDTAVQWNSTHVDADIISNPNMRVYITRWGINDGSIHGDVPTYIAAMDSALAKLRAFKGVEYLTIVVMAPNSTYDPTLGRDENWYESMVPELRKICRKYMCTFMDTYSIWQDAKQGALAGVPRWLDATTPAGEGVHPDAAFNHQIVWRTMKMILEPVMSRPGLATNTFSNTQGVQFLPTTATVPDGYSTGITLWQTKTSEGWLVDGKLRVFRNGNKVIQELFFTGLDDVQNDATTTPKFFRWGDATLNVWTKWYNEAVAPALSNGWVAVSSRLAKYVHNDNGLCSLMGLIGSGADGAVAFVLPVEMRPSVPRSFPCATSSLSIIGTVIVDENGNVIPYKNGGTSINLDGVIWTAGN